MDRDQLSGLIDRTLDALNRRDPARIPLAAGARYTENGQTLAFGKGLWATADGDQVYRRARCIAPATGQAAWFGSLTENGNPVVLALRIRAADGKIAELETVICRGHERLFSAEGMRVPRPEFDVPLAPGQLVPRQALIDAANAYFNGIEQSNGTIIPVADDCARVENGVQATMNKTAAGNARFSLWGMPVAAQIDSGYYAYIEAIRDRRYPVIDEERGLVLGIVAFDHPATKKSVEVKGHGTIDLPAYALRPSTTLIAELFQIRGGRITGIEAVLNFFPYGMKSGWE